MASLKDLANRVFNISRKPYEAVYGGKPNIQRQLVEPVKREWGQYKQQMTNVRRATTDPIVRSGAPFVFKPTGQAYQKFKIPYNPPSLNILKGQGPVVKWARPLEESEELKLGRQKALSGVKLSPKETKALSDAILFKGMDFAMMSSAPTKVKIKPRVAEGGLYDIPDTLRPLARNTVWGKYSKERFLKEFDTGLKSKNLTVRETVRNTISELKKHGMTPESFYDRYASRISRIDDLERAMSRATGDSKKYSTLQKEWQKLKYEGISRTPKEIKVAQKALDESLNVAQQPKGVIKPPPKTTSMAAEEVKSKVVSKYPEATKKTGPFNWLDELRRRLENEYHPVEKIGKIARGKGMELTSLQDPEILVKRNLGSVGIAEGELMGFGDIIRPHADEIADLNAYLVSKRAIDLEGRGIKTGINLSDAQETVRQFGPRFEATAQKIYLYQRSILHNYLVQTGMLSDDAFRSIVNANPNYIPYKRLFEEAGIEYVPSSGVKMPIKRIKGSEREILNPMESVVENTYKAVTAGEQNRLWRSVAQIGNEFPELGIKKAPPKIVPVAKVDGKEVFRPSFWNPKPNTISFFENGKRVFYEVPPEIAKVANELGSSFNIITKVLSYPTKLVRTGATGVNPEFALIRNPLRDQFTALWNSESGYKPFYDMFKGISHFSGSDDLYRQYLVSGAGNSYLVSLDREFKAKTIEELLSGKVVIRKGGLLSKLQDVSQLTEIGTRVGEYERALAKTGDPYMAAKAAREVTVDFSRIGKDARVANQLIPFINARVQGTIQAVKSAIKHPVRSGVLGVSLGAMPATLLYLHNRQYPEYYDVHDYEKQKNWIVMYGKPGEAKKFEIPKDFIIGQLFGSTTENFLSYVDKSNPDAMKNLAQNIFEFFSPIANPGEALPAAAKPIAEHVANKSFFLDRELVPDYMKARPTSGQYHKGTREIAKIIGSKIGLAPTVVDNYLYGYFPGLFTETINLVDFALGGNKFEDAKKLPFIRVFTVSGTGKIDSEIKDAYYDIQDREKAISSIKRSTTYSNEEKDRLIREEVELIGKSAERLNKFQQIQEGRIGVDFKIFKDKEGGYQVRGMAKDVEAIGTKLNLPSDFEASQELLKDARSRVKSLENKLLTLPYEPMEDYEEYSRQYKIGEAEKDLERWQKVIAKFESERPEQVFKIDLGTYGRGHPSNILVEDRGAWAVEQLEGKQGEEWQETVNKLWDAGVLTGKSNGVAQYIQDTYGIDVWNYTGTEADEGYGKKAGVGKKPKKVTLKTAKMKAPATVKIKTGGIPKVKFIAPPNVKVYQSKPVKITTSVAGIPAIKLKPVNYGIKIVKT